MPAPADEVVVGDVIEKSVEGATAILFGVFDLAAEVGGGAADENHFVFRRRKAPPGISGRHVRTGKIDGLMAGIAAHAVDAVAVFAAFYILKMDVTVVALEWRVTGGMAILAAWRS
jgi:hypothetical protein